MVQNKELKSTIDTILKNSKPVVNVSALFAIHKSQIIIGISVNKEVLGRFTVGGFYLTDKNYLTDSVLVLNRDFRKVGDKYIFWYDEMSNEDIEELENLFKTSLRVKKNRNRFEDGGDVAEDFIIRDKDSDRYFARALSGNVKWNDSQDMAYMFTKREAELVKSKLELDGYSSLSVQKYDKDWWKN